jgi:hypothetical protein
MNGCRKEGEGKQTRGSGQLPEEALLPTVLEWPQPPLSVGGRVDLSLEDGIGL